MVGWYLRWRLDDTPKFEELASSGQVAAYARREGRHVVLVVANLGATLVSGVALSSEDGALPSGRYVPRGLLESGDAAPLSVANGRLQGYVPLPTLGPLQVRVFELVSASR